MSAIDSLILQVDKALRSVMGPAHALRPQPGDNASEAPLSSVEKTLAGRLLRVDHAGEVCAQALYQGQAMTARNPAVREALERAAQEETDHLAWCETRLQELGARRSVLNPLWYAGSFTLGAISGLAGDRWNLAFLAETERQVEDHLAGHLDRLPPEDLKSRAIVEQMKVDEARHATTAIEYGAAELPAPLKLAMRLASKVMTTASHWF